jgi:hypothetical protein
VINQTDGATNLLKIMFNKTRIITAISVLLASLNAALPANAQDKLGTSFGLPNTTPSVAWPHGVSLESLGGINRLYPNGPEFGLSNTSGGFGMIGSGPMSAVGLVQNSVSPLVREELERPFSAGKELTDIFKGEAARNTALISSILSGRFRTELAKDQIFEPAKVTQMGISMPNVDAVLRDQPFDPDAILNSSFR